ncbi:glycosyltransferase [Nocardioides sp.]|uniref:glycosyltransferase n=1 Tax=Nocardioides sp. TaxID=35761 RepID=UPI003518896D
MTDRGAPLLTVVLPSRDLVGDAAASLIARCHALVASGLDVELLVVDDRSPVAREGAEAEPFRAWIRETAAAGSRVRLVVGDGVGVAAARNRGAGAARGRYLWFVDDDDDWGPDGAATLLDAALAHDADVVMADAVLVRHGRVGRAQVVADGRGAGEASGARVVEDLVAGRVSGHLWNKLLRRDLVVAAGFPDLLRHSDLAGLLRLLPAAGRVVRVPTPVYTYRVRDGSLLTGDRMRWRDLPDCLDLAREVGPAPAVEVFAVVKVAVPLFQDVARRGTSLPPSEAAEARAWVRAALTPRRIVATLRSGRPVAALGALVMRAAPRVYAGVYRRRRAGSVRPGRG